MSAVPLAVRLPNWVGDVCMALPALGLLQSHGHDLRLFGRGWACDLLAGHPWRVEKLEKGWRPAARQLSGSGARRMLLLANSFSSAWQARWAGLAATGYRGDLRSWLLAEAVERPGPQHEVEAFWRLAARFAPGAPTRPPPVLGLVLHDRHCAQAELALRQAGVTGPFRVLAPLAAGKIGGRSKVWPGFPLLCRLLCESGGTVVACPGPGEEDATRAALPGAALLPGLGLGAYAAVCRRSQGVVANDSGPMHLAAAAGAPVLGVFGVGDPSRTRPWSPRARVVGSGQGWPGVEEVVAALPGGQPQPAP